MPKNGILPYKKAFSVACRLIAGHRKYFAAASCSAVLLTGTGLYSAYLTQEIINRSIDGRTELVFRNICVYIAVALINFVLIYAKGRFASLGASYWTRDLKQGIATALLSADYAEISPMRAGDMLSTVNSDTDTVCKFLDEDLVNLLSQVCLLLGALTYLLCVNPRLALVTLAYTPVGMFFTLKLSGKMNRLYPKRADASGDALSALEQALMQLPVIKSFIMEKHIRARIAAQYEAVYKIEMKISVSNALLQTACQSTSSIPRLLYLIFAGLLVMRGALSIGTLFSVLELLTYIIGPTVYFPFILNSLNRAVASLDRIDRIGTIKKARMPDARPLAGAPALSIGNMTFGYDAKTMVFENLSFNYEGAGIIALKGRSGAGKTTLLDLLSGLLTPRAGVAAVSGSISAVMRDTYIFSGTISENVRIAEPNSTNALAEAALNRAGLSAAEFDGGYGTAVGDGKNDLSGGQRQRIGLARTFLSGAMVWLLDEPTASLDRRRERAVLQVLKEERGRRLIIIAAHKKSIRDIADVVLDLDHVKGGVPS